VLRERWDGSWVDGIGQSVRQSVSQSLPIATPTPQKKTQSLYPYPSIHPSIIHLSFMHLTTHLDRLLVLAALRLGADEAQRPQARANAAGPGEEVELEQVGEAWCVG
jgi:hypothetical protein